MKKLAAALAFLCASSLAAQPVPSSYVPLNPCAFYDGTIPAGLTAYLLTRGACNVPISANAVAFVAEAVAPSSNGYLRVWESGLPLSSAKAILDFSAGAGTTSTFAFVRLCYPVLECSGVDLAVSPSIGLHVVLKIVGYTIPN